MAEFISIKEFSELAGVSTQALYKRIRKQNNSIQPFLKKENNQFTIDKSALYLLYGIKEEETTTQPSIKVNKPLKEKEAEKQETRAIAESKPQEETAEQKVIAILREQIEAQRKDIEEKNKQIENLNNMLIENQRMLDQQQRLNMADKKQILMLEEKAGQSRGLISRFINLFKKETDTENN